MFKLLFINVFYVFIVMCSSVIASVESKRAMEAVSLQLNWKHQFEFAGYYAAQEKGFYQDVGLVVEIREYKEGTKILDDVLDKKADYGVYYSNLVDFYLKGKPVVFLANFFKSSPLIIVSQPEIKSPAGLKGKTVMTVDGLDLGHFAPMFNRYNIKSEDLNYIPHTFSVDDFVNKKVDAMMVFTTNELYELNQRNIDFNILNPAIFGLPFYDGNLFTSEHLVETNPEQVRRFRSATIKGWDYALTHKDEIIKLILKAYNTKKTYEELAYEAEEIDKIVLPRIHLLGSIEKSHVKTMAGVFAQSNTAINFSGDIEAFLFKESELNSLRLSKQEVEFLHKKGLLRYCVDPDWMPFEAIDENGDLQGMSSKVISLLKNYLDIPVRMIKTNSWAESLKFVEERKCDFLIVASNTQKRRSYMKFTEPYVFLSSVIATKDQPLFIEDLQQVVDERLGVVKGYSFIEELKKDYPEINLIEVESIAEGLTAVQSGHLFGFIDTIPAITYAIQEQGILDVRIAGKLSLQKKMGMAARSDEAELVIILDKILKTIGPAKIREIYTDGLNVKYVEKIDHTMIWQGASVMIFVLLLILYRGHLLKIKNKDLEVLSSTDALTQLNNRLKIENIMDVEMARAHRYETDMTIILLDIDDFKEVNDTLGHDVGDKVLISLSNILKINTRETDSAGRWGGEEFLIVCPGIDIKGGAMLAEMLRKKIQNHDFPLIDQCTVSLGVACMRQNENLRDLLKRSDQALYTAKEKGKNQVSLSDDV